MRLAPRPMKALSFKNQLDGGVGHESNVAYLP